MPRKNDLSRAIDENQKGFYSVKNGMYDDWAIILGNAGMNLFHFYCRCNNLELDQAWPGYRYIRGVTGMSPETISQYNWLLEQCGLLEITPGNSIEPNVYQIKKFIAVTDKILAHLSEVLSNPTLPVLGGEAKTREKWEKFKKQILAKVKVWKPLKDRLPKHHKPRFGQKEDVQPVLPKIETAEVQLDTTLPLDHSPELDKLTEAFGSETVAKNLIAKYGEAVCSQQLAWWARRCEIAEASGRGLNSPTGLLRKSIEGNWSEPPATERPLTFSEELRIVNGNGNGTGPKPGTLGESLAESAPHVIQVVELSEDERLWKGITEYLETQPQVKHFSKILTLKEHQGDKFIITASGQDVLLRINRSRKILDSIFETVVGRPCEIIFEEMSHDRYSSKD